MRCLLVCVLSSVMLVCSCDKKRITTSDIEHTVSLPVKIDNIQTKNEGGLSTLDPTKYDLRYILEVFQDEQPIKRIVNIAKIFEGTTLNVRLLEGSYEIVIWADFVPEGEIESAHYNTSSLRNISIADHYVGNDDSKDAYFTPAITINVGNDIPIPDIKLYRPLAKIVFVNKGLDFNVTSPITIKYNAQIPTHFDAYNGSISGYRNNTTYTVTPVNDYNPTDKSQTIIWDWLFVRVISGSDVMDCTIMGDGINPKTISNIELRRGVKTQITGNILMTL